MDWFPPSLLWPFWKSQLWAVLSEFWFAISWGESQFGVVIALLSLALGAAVMAWLRKAWLSPYGWVVLGLLVSYSVVVGPARLYHQKDEEISALKRQIQDERDAHARERKSDAELRALCVDTLSAAQSFLTNHPPATPAALSFQFRNSDELMKEVWRRNGEIEGKFRELYAAKVLRVCEKLRQRELMTDDEFRSIQFKLGGPAISFTAPEVLAVVQSWCLALGD